MCLPIHPAPSVFRPPTHPPPPVVPFRRSHPFPSHPSPSICNHRNMPQNDTIIVPLHSFLYGTFITLMAPSNRHSLLARQGPALHCTALCCTIL
mmetsp:Transcript_22763/g.38135  ORF Transcript_22763/g.38135 Transcript_22763/m.38135 type:complete len:94 (-) Transcript_22763:312-593(-)